jgi:hypothetical protein
MPTASSRQKPEYTDRNARIIELRAAGMSYPAISRELHVSRHVVALVINYWVPPQEPQAVKQKNCTRCRKPFVTTRFVFRCDDCRETCAELRDDFAGVM